MKNQRETIYANKLSEMIKLETVYTPNSEKKFEEFFSLLRKLFPNLANSTKWEIIHGSLLITWKSNNPNHDPYIFMNHSDVVEASGKWEHDPFGGEIIDGYLWGRGAIDNKGALFTMLQAADELIDAGFNPDRDIYFVSGNDEEKSDKGAKAIAKHLYELGVKSEITFDEGGIITEQPLPFANGHYAMISLGEKRSVDLKFIAKSNGGHTSMPTVDSPMVRLSMFITEIKTHDPFKRQMTPIICAMLKAFSPHSSKFKFFLAHPKIFGPIFKMIAKKSIPGLNAMMQTTIDFTMAQGSQAVNAVPDIAWIGANIRAIHHQNFEQSMECINKVANKYNIEIEIIQNRIASRVMDPNCKAFQLVSQAVKETIPPVKESVPYLSTAATDLRELDYISGECIRFSPLMVRMSELDSMHGLNEKVRIDCLPYGVDYYKYLMKK